MADETRPAQGNTTIQRNPSQTPASGIGAPNPQNLNRSPSPGGDGVQSSQSERTAAGLDRTMNQPGQQRVNAAERRERGENVRPGDKAGLRPGIIQSPGEVLPGEAAAEAINASEQARLRRQEEEHAAQFSNLPQSTIDEMNAGKEALKRHQRKPPAPTSTDEDVA